LTEQTQLVSKTSHNPARLKQQATPLLQRAMLVNLLSLVLPAQLRFLASVFAAGDVVSIFNNTSGDIAITCTIAEAYIAGVNTDETQTLLR
jgi:hypothetical protein